MGRIGSLAKFFVHVPGTPFVEIDGGFRNVVDERPLLVQGPRGHTTLVHLTSMGGKVFLGSGWPEFLYENGIHKNDIILCELDQKLKMKVQICNQAVQTQMYAITIPATATNDKKQSKDKNRKIEGREEKEKADDGEEDSEFEDIEIQGKEKGQISVEEGIEDALATQKFKVTMNTHWLERGISIPAEYAEHMPPKGRGFSS